MNNAACVRVIETVLRRTSRLISLSSPSHSGFPVLLANPASGSKSSASKRLKQTLTLRHPPFKFPPLGPSSYNTYPSRNLHLNLPFFWWAEPVNAPFRYVVSGSVTVNATAFYGQSMATPVSVGSGSFSSYPDTADTTAGDGSTIEIEKDNDLPHPETSNLLVLSELKKEVV